MNSTYQFKNINMLEHGKMVHESYISLLTELRKENVENCLSHFSLEERKWILHNQYPINIMDNYHIYHDCGKPYCKTMSIDGKQSFPNHAQISQEIYNKYFNNAIISEMILLDMHFHTLKSNELEIWLDSNKSKKKLLASLYLTAWSELLANSTMFGGVETTSFKIKKKALIQAGKKLFRTQIIFK